MCNTYKLGLATVEHLLVLAWNYKRLKTFFSSTFPCIRLNKNKNLTKRVPELKRRTVLVVFLGQQRGMPSIIIGIGIISQNTPKPKMNYI